MALISPWGRKKVVLTGKTLSLREKEYIAFEVNCLGRCPTELQNKYGLSRSAVRKYAEHVLKGITLHDGGGAPPKFDSMSRETITKMLGGEKRIQVSAEDAKIIYKDEQMATASRRNQAVSQQTSPDKRTITKLEADLNIKSYRAEETTDAREIACANVRNTVSTLVQFNSGSILSPHGALQGNFDSTTVQVGDKSLDPKRRAKMIGGVQQNKSIKVKKRNGQAGITAYFIKLYAAINAIGGYGELVYCLADANMKEGDMDWYEIDAGVFGLNQHDKAHIVFSKTRAMGDAFCEKYWRKIVIPFMVAERERYGLDGKMAQVNCDGESSQIDVFATTTIYQEVKEADITVDKPSGSTTEITQACDQELFIEMKKENKKYDDSDVDIDSPEFKCITTILAKHQTKTKKLMPPAHVRQAAFGLMRVRMAAQNALTGPRARRSFVKIGQWPFDKKKVLQQCTTKLTVDQEAAIFAALPKLTSQYDSFGELVQKNFDDANIFNNDIPGKKLKEDGATNRKRSCRLTHHVQHDQMLAKQPAREVAKEKCADLKKRKEASDVVAKQYQPRQKKPRLVA